MEVIVNPHMKNARTLPSTAEESTFPEGVLYTYLHCKPQCFEMGNSTDGRDYAKDYLIR